MRIIGTRKLRTCWKKQPRAEQPLKAWHAIAVNAKWSSPADVKAAYGNASIIGNGRMVFNIGGNKFRLIVHFDYRNQVGRVCFAGTHAEYDSIDASSVGGSDERQTDQKRGRLRRGAG